MDELACLPSALTVCSSTATLHSMPAAACVVSASDLAALLSAARSSNVHTQPPPVSEKENKRAAERAAAFHSSQLNVFLRAYEAGATDTFTGTLRELLELCGSMDSEWTFKCQAFALSILITELESRQVGVVPREQDGEPSMLPQLRSNLPPLRGRVPQVAISPCHFRFVDLEESGAPGSAGVFGAEVRVTNNGLTHFSLRIARCYTVVDGGAVSSDVGDAACGAVEATEVRSGESAVLKLLVDEQRTRKPFRTLEQLFVLLVSEAIPVFVSITVIRPNQAPFGVSFPACMPLAVQEAALGPYRAPLMLQILKHQFIRQQGLADREVAHLLLGKSSNYSVHNREIIRAALRVREAVEASLDMRSVLTAFWKTASCALARGDRGSSSSGSPSTSSSSAYKSAVHSPFPHGVPDGDLAEMLRRFPVSTAQPAGYLPCGVLPTAAARVTSSMSSFPNAAVPLPEALVMAPAKVVFVLILLYLADFRQPLFDMSIVSADPVRYLATMLTHLKGVVLWIVDLCCAMLAQRQPLDITVRHLALTFAAVLIQRRLLFPGFSSAQVTSVGGDKEDPAVVLRRQSEAFVSSVTLQQHVTTAFVRWITMYEWAYAKYKVVESKRGSS